MQSLNWYYNRLRSMSAAEILWRVQGAARNRVDRLLHERRKRPPSLSAILLPNRDESPLEAAGEIVGKHLTAGKKPNPLTSEQTTTLIAQADAILNGRIHLFGSNETNVGSPPRWNHEYNIGRDTPMGVSAAIDYRDHAVTGDCKWVWELNRHHHLVVLGRAARVTGERRYAEAVKSQILDWITACPFGCGMNWRSPLELAIRVINWVWAIELIRPSGVVDDAFMRQVYPIAYRHLWDIQRQYSRYSSANNHLIGEAAGVYVGASYFRSIGKADQWRAEAKAILVAEMASQVHADGVHMELATGYQLFVMQFFLVAGLAGRESGDEFPRDYWDRLEKMFDYVAALCEGGAPPLFNDADDGYVLDLGGAKGDARPMIGAAADVFDRADFGRLASDQTEAAMWLTGVQPKECESAQSYAKTLASRTFTDGGVYLLQAGRPGGASISLAFDAGALGFGSIAAHGHADALSFTLRVNGLEFLVDPGTFDYFTYPEWRRYFKSTRAHNTIEIDGLDQSESLGLFLWGRRAVTRRTLWEDGENAVRLEAAHDGYERLPSPVTHRRSVTMDKATRHTTVCDHLIGHGMHAVRQHFHIAPECRATVVSSHQICLSRGSTAITMTFDGRTEVRVVRGSEQASDSPDFGLGWVSRRYHERIPSCTIVASCKIDGPVSLTTTISAGHISTDPGMTSASGEGYNGESQGHLGRSKCSSTPDSLTVVTNPSAE